MYEDRLGWFDDYVYDLWSDVVFPGMRRWKIRLGCSAAIYAIVFSEFMVTVW